MPVRDRLRSGDVVIRRQGGSSLCASALVLVDATLPDEHWTAASLGDAVAAALQTTTQTHGSIWLLGPRDEEWRRLVDDETMRDCDLTLTRLRSLKREFDRVHRAASECLARGRFEEFAQGRLLERVILDEYLELCLTQRQQFAETAKRSLERSRAWLQ